MQAECQESKVRSVAFHTFARRAPVSMLRNSIAAGVPREPVSAENRFPRLETVIAAGVSSCELVRLGSQCGCIGDVRGSFTSFM